MMPTDEFEYNQIRQERDGILAPDATRSEYQTYGLHTTWEEAYEAFEAAMADTANDQGEEAAEAGAHDLIHSVADDCVPAVRREWLRTQLGEPISDEALEDLYQEQVATYGRGRVIVPARLERLAQERAKEQARRNRERAKDRRKAWN